MLVQDSLSYRSSVDLDNSEISFLIFLTGVAFSNHNGPQVNMISLDEDISLKGTIVPAEGPKCVTAVCEIKKEEGTIPVFEIRNPIVFDIVPTKVTSPVVLELDFSNKAVPWVYQSGESSGSSVVFETSATQSMTKSGRYYGPNEVAIKQDISRRRLEAIAADDFWRKMQANYSVVEQLKKMPSHITILSLLMSSEDHRNALMKVLAEAQVPKETSSENLAAMVGQVLESHKISFFRIVTFDVKNLIFNLL